jgi:hypothetical protein
VIVAGDLGDYGSDFWFKREALVLYQHAADTPKIN